ncbi:MAG: hypothetical protein JSS36_07635 [Proteobacteria bacterium]|nr:hypothetical protein [Pseudomonadota bacterium]
MNRLRTITLAAGAAAVLAGLIAPAPADAGILGDAINKQLNSHGDGPTWTEHADSFKGASQVVLGQFTVVFLTKSVSYSGGGFLSTSNSAKAIGQLAGVDPATYQRVTDAVFEDFKAKLARAGITLADPAAYYASKYYQKVRSEDQGHPVTVPLDDKQSVEGQAWWPSALPHHDNMALTMRFMDANTTNVYTAQYDYARTAKLPVLNVVYVVDFAEPAKSTGGGVFQKLDVKAELAISPRGSQIQLMDTSGKVGKVVLNKPIVEGGTFAEIKDITSGLQKGAETVQMLGNIGGAIFGKGSNAFGKQMRMDRRIEYSVVDPKVWGDMVIHAGGQTNDLMTNTLGSLK